MFRAIDAARLDEISIRVGQRRSDFADLQTGRTGGSHGGHD
jgi:hypothetical protein